MTYRNIITHERRATLPGSTTYADGRTVQGDLTIEDCAPVGWRIEDDTAPVVAPGMVIVAEEWQQDPARPLYMIRVITAQRTQAEQDALDAEAAAQASLPARFDTGVAVLADGHYVELVPVADGEPVMAVQISDSPVDPATRKARVEAAVAAKMAKDSAKSKAQAAFEATAGQGQLQARIENIEKWIKEQGK